MIGYLWDNLWPNLTADLLFALGGWAYAELRHLRPARAHREAVHARLDEIEKKVGP